MMLETYTKKKPRRKIKVMKTREKYEKVSVKIKLRTNYGLEWSMKPINRGNNLQKTDI